MQQTTAPEWMPAAMPMVFLVLVTGSGAALCDPSGTLGVFTLGVLVLVLTWGRLIWWAAGFSPPERPVWRCPRCGYDRRGLRPCTGCPECNFPMSAVTASGSSTSVIGPHWKRGRAAD